MATGRTDAPHERLAAAIAAGCAPAGMHPCALRAALTRWTAWRAGRGHDPDALSPPAAAAFLDDLLAAAATPRSAFATFAAFQIAASLIWGPAAAAPLAAVLREARVTTKAAPDDRWTRAAKAVARLPAEWRGPFARVLADSRGKTRAAAVVWSADRIGAVATALRMYGVAAGSAAAPPSAGVFTAWAEAMHVSGVAPASVATYLERALAGFEIILTPGVVYDGPAVIVDRWAVRARRAPRRRAAARRTTPATTIHALGLAMMAEAVAAPVRRIGEAMLYRDGLLLALAASLPERARALAALALDRTLFLEDDGIVRVAIPADALKRGERAKAGPGVQARVRAPRLHSALSLWRAEFRPMFDDGDWLCASLRSRDDPLGEASLGAIFRRVTKARLGIAITAHDIRGCVATELIETDPHAGPARATAVLRHRDRRVTAAYYDHAEGVAACAAWSAAIARRGKGDRPDLDIDA